MNVSIGNPSCWATGFPQSVRKGLAYKHMIIRAYAHEDNISLAIYVRVCGCICMCVKHATKLLGCLPILVFVY